MFFLKITEIKHFDSNHFPISENVLPSLDLALEQKRIMDTIVAGYHLGSTHVLKFKSQDAISVLIRTVGYYKDFKMILEVSKMKYDVDKAKKYENHMKNYEKIWTDARKVVEDPKSHRQLRGYKLFYHTAKAYEIAGQLSKFDVQFYQRFVNKIFNFRILCKLLQTVH